ncbi:MAG: hypothetical protein L0H31_16300, partial [Nocardioidaceae bacterium]|nr:hypothetical protein [Nocardioidaceae bacterium]
MAPLWTTPVPTYPQAVERVPQRLRPRQGPLTALLYLHTGKHGGKSRAGNPPTSADRVSRRTPGHGPTP